MAFLILLIVFFEMVLMTQPKEEPITKSISKPIAITPQSTKEEIESEYIDTDLIALERSVFDIETLYGTSTLWNEFNNPGGYICNGSSNEQCTLDGFKIFESKEEGLNQLNLLLQEYVSVYGYDLKSIRERYCENCGEEDLQTFIELFNYHKEKLENGKDQQ